MLGWFKIEKKFAVVVGLIQILFIAFFAGFVEYDAGAQPILQKPVKTPYVDDGYVNKYFSFFQDIHAMIFFGISFLYTFMKKYGYSGVSMCMLLAAITIETSLVTQNVWNAENGKIHLNIVSLISSDFAAASTLIALGGVFGKLNPLQMVFFVIFEAVFYTINEHCCIHLLQVTDLGEAVALHLFSSIFGLAVAFAVDRKRNVSNNPNQSSNYTSDLFSILGTVFLWAFWPSFNCALSSGDSQHRSAINTFLALTGSCVSAFVASSYFNKQQKFNMAHIQNATLAGGVIISSVADLMVQPSGALAIGSIGGIVTVVSFNHVTSFLGKYLQVHDPCGVNGLHSIPGALSGIFAAVACLAASKETYGYSLYSIFPAMAPKANTTALLEAQTFLPTIKAGTERTVTLQAGYQLIYVVICLTTSIVTGLLTGILLRTSFFEPLRKDQMFLDEVFWEMPSETSEVHSNSKSKNEETKF